MLIQIRTIEQAFSGNTPALDAELTALINEGWEVLDISVTSRTEDDYPTRYVTLKRAAAEKPASSKGPTIGVYGIIGHLETLHNYAPPADYIGNKATVDRKWLKDVMDCILDLIDLKADHDTLTPVEPDPANEKWFGDFAALARAWKAETDTKASFTAWRKVVWFVKDRIKEIAASTTAHTLPDDVIAAYRAWKKRNNSDSLYQAFIQAIAKYIPADDEAQS